MEDLKITSWPDGLRDVTNVPDYIQSGKLANFSMASDAPRRYYHLRLFLNADGMRWTDYSGLHSLKGALGFPGQIQDQRLRTYRKFYQSMGVIYPDCQGYIRLSPLGRKLNDLREQVAIGISQDKMVDLRRCLIEHAAMVLSRYQFNHPTSRQVRQRQVVLPEDFDVRPYFSIWKAMCSLDGKLHYEELNRVILKVLKQTDLDAAISIIQVAREATNGSYRESNQNQLFQLLGEQVQKDQPNARMTAQISPAGFGGLLIESNVRADGFRHFAEEAYPIIKSLVSNTPSYYTGTDIAEWNAHFLSTVPLADPAIDLQNYEHQLEGLTETDALELRKSRVGQGQFRDDLMEVWNGCSVTGLSNRQLLTASHLKPWRDSSNSERLDPYNGLILIPNLDRLLDRGFVTFQPDGQCKVSSVLSAADRRVMAAMSVGNLRLRAIHPQNHKYLEYHRTQVFQNWL